MADQNGPGVNSTPMGNDGHSVESAADDFTAMLAEEGRHDRRQSRGEGGRFASQSPEESDDAATGDDGKAKRQPPKREREEPANEGEADDADPILDDAPAAPKAKDKGEADDDDADDTDQDDQNDQDGDDEGDDDQDGDDPLDAEHEVTINGEKVNVTVRDALAGYMKDADYRQGTERNAREYEEVQTFAAETVETRKRTDTALSEAMALIEALQPSKEDWDALEKNDPPGYIAAQKHWQGLLEKARGIHTTRNQLVADQTAEANQARAKYLRDEDRKLLTAFPALRDEKKADSFRQTIMEYGRKAGFSDAELIDGAVDHRTLITLYKAARYDQIRTSSSAAGRKASGKGPKSSAETRPKPTPGRSANRTASREADRRLQRTGSLQDAAASFAELVRS